MRSSRNGRSTFPVSIAGISARGFWLSLGERKLFVAYAAFPWFRDFTVRELAAVKRPAAGHLRWPVFDLDIEVEALEHPDRFPLIEKRLRGDPARVVARLREERKRRGGSRASA